MQCLMICDELPRRETKRGSRTRGDTVVPAVMSELLHHHPSPFYTTTIRKRYKGRHYVPWYRTLHANHPSSTSMTQVPLGLARGPAAPPPAPPATWPGLRSRPTARCTPGATVRGGSSATGTRRSSHALPGRHHGGLRDLSEGGVPHLGAQAGHAFCMSRREDYSKKRV